MQRPSCDLRMSPHALFIVTKCIATLQQSNITAKQSDYVGRIGACSASDWHFYVHRPAPQLIVISFPCGAVTKSPWLWRAGGFAGCARQTRGAALPSPCAQCLCTRCSVNKLWGTRASWFRAARSFTQTAWKVMPLRSLDVQAEGSREVSIYVFINAFYSREPAVAS